MKSDRETRRLCETAVAVYSGCRQVLSRSCILVHQVLHFKRKEWKPDSRTDVAGLAKNMRGLDALCDELDQRMKPVRAAFRAAFGPPCLVNGKPYPSYHEGVLSFAKYDLVGIDEPTLNSDAWKQLQRAGFRRINTRAHKPLLDGTPDLKAEDALEQFLVKSWSTECERITRIKVDLVGLLCALDKEIAKVVITVAGPHSAAPVPWSGPMSLGDLADKWGVSKNTATSRCRELQKTGRARKVGRSWDVDQDALPDPGICDSQQP